LINVSIGMGHPPFSVEQAVLGLTHVNWIVAEFQCAKAFPERIFVVSGPTKIWN
jgi:hypothetical protein